jgi:methyl-accepting chemotaxis protein
MSVATSQQHPAAITQTSDDTIAVWRDAIAPAVTTLRLMAGTTEDEFLQIGSEVQGFYQRSTDITRMSNQLVEIVSNDCVTSLAARLRQMMADMDTYLVEARTRSGDSCNTLEMVLDLLRQLSEPMVGFQKMNKTLRMLSISTKIESSRLGEMGSGFVNLAMDVEKLSHQVNEKSAVILAHQRLLATMIASNLINVRSTEAGQDAQVALSLKETAARLEELVTVNERCTLFGITVSTISAEITANISEVVSSIQMHDMTRQQIEHIVEALERLSGKLAGYKSDAADNDRFQALIAESGDVCELQEAQLRFAAAELYMAVCSILDNLREVADKQSAMAHETQKVTGVAGSSGTSFVDAMSHEMTAVTATLASCALADQDMSDTMKKVAQTISEITTFVTDIEAIGSEIDLIALNAQIQAAHTGPEGAALGVLAEAIKRLSDEAMRQTDAVAKTLTKINAITKHLSVDIDGDEKQLGGRITRIQEEVAEILRALADINTELLLLLSGLSGRVASLTDDVEQLTSRIEVHEQAKGMSERVLAALEQIVAQARLIIPASSEFKQNLHHMEERYTMESERHIHEALARKRSGQDVVDIQANAHHDDSEFGDNVDLF